MENKQFVGSNLSPVHLQQTCSFVIALVPRHTAVVLQVISNKATNTPLSFSMTGSHI